MTNALLERRPVRFAESVKPDEGRGGARVDATVERVILSTGDEFPDELHEPAADLLRDQVLGRQLHEEIFTVLRELTKAWRHALTARERFIRRLKQLKPAIELALRDVRRDGPDLVPAFQFLPIDRDVDG